MKKRTVNLAFAFAVAFLLLGADDLITQRGSHVLSESVVYRAKPLPGTDVRYTGRFATLEGLVFVAAGAFFAYRAWAGGGSADDDEDPR